MHGSVVPWMWMVAGPNGVGKTTYARGHLRAVTGSIRFANADELARGYSPLEPDAARVRAARALIELAGEYISAGVTFAVETTLAGRGHLSLARRAKAAGLRFGLLYFAVADVDTCLERIRRRVAVGGHDVPEADVRRRFVRSAANFPLYAAAADLWRVFDNTGPTSVAAEGLGTRVAWRDGTLPEHVAGLLRGLEGGRGGEGTPSRRLPRG